jgi:hypothetical protein
MPPLPCLLSIAAELADSERLLGNSGGETSAAPAQSAAVSGGGLEGSNAENALLEFGGA